MLEEGSGASAMEKKISARQTQGQCKLNGGNGDRKSDSTPTKHGRNSSNGGGAKAQDVGQTSRPVPIQKWDRSYSDRRQRQRFYQDDRPCETVVDKLDILDVVSTRKVNANHLLNFKYTPYNGRSDDQRWCGRNRYGSHGHSNYRKVTRYKKEQFLQASCQFVVRDTGDYAEQAIDSDALVDWEMVELVRSYTTEPVTCPICLQIPAAGKIAKCGHTFCWACILHYIKLGEAEIRKCPICYFSVDIKELRSVQWIDVPDYKIGDEIEMRLMRRSRGSTYAIPKDQWGNMKGGLMNIQDGENSKFMKLLVSSCDQIKKDVIDRERDALTIQMVDAEDSELPFIEMALEYLDTREKSLKDVFQKTFDNRGKVYIPGMGSKMVRSPKIPVPEHTAQDSSNLDTHPEDNLDDKSEANAVDDAGAACAGIEEAKPDCNHIQSTTADAALPFGSPPSPYPPMQDAEVNPLPLGLEETAEQLELPMDAHQSEKQRHRKAQTLSAKNDYFFFQASTGQQIYLNSLNSKCLAEEYGSLEESPGVIKGTVVAIERIFMTEDVRKRLRYLGHIPLTCEFHVVELKLKPPLISKETLKVFEAAFEKKRKMRQQKAKEDKRRAKKFELEQRKSIGLFPEMKIPLDNLNHFPSHLPSNNLEEEPAHVLDSPTSGLPDTPKESKSASKSRVRNDSTTSDESSSSGVSFAQMLKVTNPPPTLGGAWGKAPAAPPSFFSASERAVTTPKPRFDDDSDGESLPAPPSYYSMSDAFTRALQNVAVKDGALNLQVKTRGKKKKKKDKN